MAQNISCTIRPILASFASSLVNFSMFYGGAVGAVAGAGLFAIGRYVCDREKLPSKCLQISGACLSVISIALFARALSLKSPYF